MPAQTASALAQQLVGGGVQFTNPVLTCAPNANGVFTALNAGLGLDSGIVLTTGAAATNKNYVGVNGPSSLLASTNNNMPGDAMLNVVSGQSTKDACSLEFDFVPRGDSIRFQYVFSSEEYINATCGPYNDAFAFLISGPGISGQKNLALVPGTNIPVTINSINSGVPGSGYSLANCTSMGPGSPFTNEYVDNTNGLYLTHKGRTMLLDARFGVQPCSTYHLKFVIADAGNYLYDSGVFLRAGSLQSNDLSTYVTAPRTPIGQQFIVKGCAPATVQVKTSQRPIPQIVKMILGGTAVKGVEYTIVADSLIIPANTGQTNFLISPLQTPKNGVKMLTIKFKSPFACSNELIADSISLLIYDSIALRVLTPDTTLCARSSFTIRAVTDSIVKVQWMPLSFLNDATIIQPVSTPLQPIKYFVKGTVPGAGCMLVQDSLSIQVLPTPTVFTMDQTVCNHNAVTLQATVSPNYDHYTYQWFGPDNFSSKSLSPWLNRVTPNNAGQYIIQVKTDTSNCIAEASMILTVVAPAPPTFTSPIAFCQENKVHKLSIAGSNIVWYHINDTIGHTDAPTINAATEGTYHFLISQKDSSCESELLPITIEVKRCCEGHVIIPSAFSPNGDGLNDLFRLKPDFGNTVIQLDIFNRWGQLVFRTFNNEAWDGTFHGVPAELGVYFYDAKIACAKGGQMRYTGDVMLVH
ncbi:MAG: gliding motility-associated C-terminal domain-containing protein [Bacteroidetes bacterium]|nr:gliding motility-associated C-terminal domain-containing protein [Bacteroidota bacterium]